MYLKEFKVWLVFKVKKFSKSSDMYLEIKMNCPFKN